MADFGSMLCKKDRKCYDLLSFRRAFSMGRFVEGQDCRQDFLLPASLDDYVSEDSPFGL